MIGLLIGLIGIVVIMETFAVSEGYRRTTTSGADAQTNGAIAMYLMQRELRVAGYNMQPFLVAGCTSVIVWNETLGKSQLLRWVPVDINPTGYPAGDPNTDVVLIAYGTADSYVGGVQAWQVPKVRGAPVVRTDPFSIAKNIDGFRAGDLAVSVMPASPTPSCVMHEITSTPGANGNCGQTLADANTVVHDYKTYRSFYNGCQNVLANHDSAAGINDPIGAAVPVVTYPRGLMFNFGPSPAAKIYAIRNQNLTVCSSPDKDCTDPANYDVIVNGIVSMHAILGGDYAGTPINATSGIMNDGTVDQWSRNAIKDSGDARRTMAVALELTARSSLREKSSTGNPDPAACDATANPNLPDNGQKVEWYASYVPKAVGSLGGAQIDISKTAPDPQWKCYRYKLFTGVVTLRNMFWTPG